MEAWRLELRLQVERQARRGPMSHHKDLGRGQRDHPFTTRTSNLGYSLNGSSSSKERGEGGREGEAICIVFTFHLHTTLLMSKGTDIFSCPSFFLPFFPWPPFNLQAASHLSPFPVVSLLLTEAGGLSLGECCSPGQSSKQVSCSCVGKGWGWGLNPLHLIETIIKQDHKGENRMV